MTLSESLSRKLGEPRPTSPGRHTMTHQDAASGWTVNATTEQADALSSRLWELSLQPTTPSAPLDGPALRQKATAIAGEVTGLLEPLRVIECDTTRPEAVLRSEEPTVRGDKRGHYELRVDGQRKATLRRYEAGTEPAAKREQIPFTLTHEVIGHVAEDLATTLS